MLKVVVNVCRYLLNDNICYFYCSGCNKLTYFTMVNNSILGNIHTECPVCGTKIPRIGSLLKQSNARAQYHIEKSVHECERIIE